MAKLTANAVPNPGSDEAAAKGCTCARIDNAYGKGYFCQPGVFVITDGCPLHAPRLGRQALSENRR